MNSNEPFGFKQNGITLSVFTRKARFLLFSFLLFAHCGKEETDGLIEGE